MSGVERRWPVRQCAAILRRGGVVAYPTEAVFGLGCDPLDSEAVARILAIKGRSWRQGLILIGADLDQLRPWMAEVSPETVARLQASWPGPTTWLVPAAHWVPEWLTGGRPTIAVRVPGHPLARALCRLAGRALVSTSANRSSRPAARKALQVRRWLGNELDAVLGGETLGYTRPSTIRDAASGRVVRHGAADGEQA
jgi:L-threonylcarbamoyladenylate synthase